MQSIGERESPSQEMSPETPVGGNEWQVWTCVIAVIDKAEFLSN